MKISYLLTILKARNNIIVHISFKELRPKATSNRQRSRGPTLNPINSGLLQEVPTNQSKTFTLDIVVEIKLSPDLEENVIRFVTCWLAIDQESVAMLSCAEWAHGLIDDRIFRGLICEAVGLGMGDRLVEVAHFHR
jgi:hypothetical protein